MFYVYILRSLKTGRLYVGHTDDMARRLCEHNGNRGGAYSRQNAPWELLYLEEQSIPQGCFAAHTASLTPPAPR